MGTHLDSNAGSQTPSDPEEKSFERDSDVWITTVLPAVVIAVILVLGACIACILYKVTGISSNGTLKLVNLMASSDGCRIGK